ncbi:MAG: hypothetical protein Q9218_002715 [Villophora microphyllina]
MAYLVSSLSRDASDRTLTRGRQRSAEAQAQATWRADDLERHLFRRFRPGDIYAPHDLSSTEQHKWRQRRPSANIDGRGGSSHHTSKGGKQDVFDVLNIHPLDEFKNPSMMTEYVTSMGRLRHRRETGLRAVNQRRISKAVRRAVGMGLLPTLNRLESKSRFSTATIRKAEILEAAPVKQD